VRKLVNAGKYLTIWGRFAEIQPSAGAIGAAMIYLPVTGLLIGLVLALTNYGLTPYLPSEILSITLLAVLIVLTGGLQLEALRLTFDQVGVAPAQAAWAEPRSNGTLGFIAVIMVLLFKAAALDSIDQRITVSLLLTPILARWTLLLFVFGYQERCDEVTRVIAQQVKFWQLLVATAGILALTSYWLGRKGLWIALVLSVFSLATRNLLYRFQSVLTRHNFGAMVELAETLCLTLLASL
jgi:cobalamin synthase